MRREALSYQGPVLIREPELRWAIVVQAGIDMCSSMSVRFAQIAKGVRRLFGCWHLKMSLPFTRGADTYRTCVTCGARRRFDLDQWTSVGGFYYPGNGNSAAASTTASPAGSARRLAGPSTRTAVDRLEKTAPPSSTESPSRQSEYTSVLSVPVALESPPTY